MKKIFLLSFLFIGYSFAEYEDSRVVKICDGTTAYSATQEATTLLLQSLLHHEKWTYKLAREHNLLELTMDSGQYHLTQILLNTFPQLIVQKGILLKKEYFIDSLGEDFYLNAIRNYYWLIVKEYLHEKRIYLKKRRSREEVPTKEQHPFYEYYWQMQEKEEVLHRISLQLDLTMEELISEFSQASSLNPMAASFSPEPSAKKFSKKDLIDSLTVIVGSLNLNPQKAYHETFEFKENY